MCCATPRAPPPGPAKVNMLLLLFILISPPGGSFGDVLRDAEGAAPWACDGT